MRLALVCFYCLCVFVYVLYFIATMSFAGYFLSVLFCLLSMLISDSRFDLVWFRLSCDHGWILSGSVNVRKQQQQQQQPYSGHHLRTSFFLTHVLRRSSQPLLRLLRSASFSALALMHEFVGSLLRPVSSLLRPVSSLQLSFQR